MRVGLFLEQKTASFQVGRNFGIHKLEEFSGVGRHCFSELAARVKRLDHREVVLERSLVIVFAVRGRHMNNAGSVACRDEIAADNIPAFLVDRNEAKPPFVFPSDEIPARHGNDNFCAFGYDRETLFGENQEVVFEANLHVLDIRIDSERDVGD